MYAASVGVKERRELAGLNCHVDAALWSDAVVALPIPSFKLYATGWIGSMALYM